MIPGFARVGLQLDTMKQKLAHALHWDAEHCTDAPARRDVCDRQDVLRLDVVALAGTTPQTYGLAMIDGQPQPAWRQDLAAPSEVAAPEPPDGNGGLPRPAATITPRSAVVRIARHHRIAEPRRAA